MARYLAIRRASWLFFLAVWLSAGAAAQEVVTLLAAGGYRPLASVIYGGTLLVIASNAIPLFLWQVRDDQPLARLGWPLSGVYRYVCWLRWSARWRAIANPAA